MNKYMVQYSEQGVWIPFIVLSESIYEVEEWVKAKVQQSGTCISLIDEEETQSEPTFGEWSEERILQRARRRAYVTQAA